LPVLGLTLLGLALLRLALLGLALGKLPSGPPAAGTTQASVDKHAVTILGGEPVTLDPAVQGDLGSAQVTAQLFETLTVVDPALVVEPALASGWTSADGGAPRERMAAGRGQLNKKGGRSRKPGCDKNRPRRPHAGPKRLGVR